LLFSLKRSKSAESAEGGPGKGKRTNLSEKGKRGTGKVPMRDVLKRERKSKNCSYGLMRTERGGSEG